MSNTFILLIKIHNDLSFYTSHKLKPSRLTQYSTIIQWANFLYWSMQIKMTLGAKLNYSSLMEPSRNLKLHPFIIIIGSHGITVICWILNSILDELKKALVYLTLEWSTWKWRWVGESAAGIGPFQIQLNSMWYYSGWVGLARTNNSYRWLWLDLLVRFSMICIWINLLSWWANSTWVGMPAS